MVPTYWVRTALAIGSFLINHQVAATGFSRSDQPGLKRVGLDSLPSNIRSSIPHSTATDIPADPSTAPVPESRPLAKGYIVELDAGSSLETRSGVRLDSHAHFHKRAAEEDVNYTVRREFKDSSLFNGVSIELGSDADKSKLEALHGVKGVWPIYEVNRPQPAEFDTLDIGKPVAAQFGFNTSVVRGADYQMDFNLKTAGVHHMHSHGFKGKGVNVAIIDTGVDYRHPSLGGGFGPGKKVAFGRNYIDDGQGGADDPIATCSDGGHGTHVAGIIAGQDAKDQGFGLLGVAPEATLGMYRVFACSGSTYMDILMQAMLDAVEDGAHIVSMSLGSDLGWERLDPFHTIVENAKRKGVAFVVAAGNEGRLGPTQMASPAIADAAIAVASTDAARFPTTYTVKDNEGRELRYGGLWPLEGEFYVYAPPVTTPATVGCSYQDYIDAVDYVEARGWAVEKTIMVLPQGGDCSTYTKASLSYGYGFRSMIKWVSKPQQNPQDLNYASSPPPFFTLSMDLENGVKLHDAYQSDRDGYRLQFIDKRFTPVDMPSAGFTSNFSTFGNTWEFTTTKPTIAAPGHLILSSWPLEAGGYNIISGTSMATPFVAGCYAVLKSAFPKLSVDELTNMFTTTAVAAKFWGASDVIHGLSHQGAGAINVWNAYNSGMKFEQGWVNVGQSAKPVVRNITFTNTLGRGKTFTISHTPAGMINRTPYKDLDKIGWYVHGFASFPVYASVEFETATNITLKTGETAVVSFVVKPPAADPNTIPTYSGFITFKSGRDVYNVPYMGLPYVVSEQPVIAQEDVDGAMVPGMMQSNWFSFEEVFTPGDIIVYDRRLNVTPSVTWWAPQPHDIFRQDLVAANTTFKPDFYGFNPDNHIETNNPYMPVIQDWGGVQSYGIVWAASFNEPSYVTSMWAGYLFDGDGAQLDYTAPAGDYRWLLRFLPLGLDGDNPKNWQSWLGPIMRFPVPFKWD